jgi:hypothetical protein
VGHVGSGQPFGQGRVKEARFAGVFHAWKAAPCGRGCIVGQRGQGLQSRRVHLAPGVDSMPRSGDARPRRGAGRRSRMERNAAFFLILRFLVYAALVAGTFEWMVMAVHTHDLHWLMRDDGPVEMTQLAAALLTAILFFLLSRRSPRSADLLRFFSALSLIACARELDNFSLEMGSRPAYIFVAMLPLGWALATLWQARRTIFGQLVAFSRTSAFALLLAGFLIVVVFAQILGQKALWMTVLPIDIYRPVKELVEESCELLGYLLMLFGAAEAAVEDHRE